MVACPKRDRVAPRQQLNKNRERRVKGDTVGLNFLGLAFGDEARVKWRLHKKLKVGKQ